MVYHSLSSLYFYLFPEKVIKFYESTRLVSSKSNLVSIVHGGMGLLSGQNTSYPVLRECLLEKTRGTPSSNIYCSVSVLIVYNYLNESKRKIHAFFFFFLYRSFIKNRTISLRIVLFRVLQILISFQILSPLRFGVIWTIIRKNCRNSAKS